MSSLYSIQYMQDMTHSICADAKENDTVQLIDKRPNADDTNPKYWVTKLRDGNCWMTQNLDLDIPASGLTTALSDMTTDWNSSSTYKPVATQTSSTPSFTGSSSTPNVVQSWDPGIKLCSAANACTAPTVSDYDAHYLSGNYYTWGAATAGQAASFTANAIAQATQSICPKGWALPVNGAYGDLFTSYGKYQSNTLLYGEQSIINSPLYFIRGGYVNGSSLSNAGSQGYYWSSTAYNAVNAYDLYFTTSVTPSHSWGRFFGFSVRCVAR